MINMRGGWVAVFVELVSFLMLRSSQLYRGPPTRESVQRACADMEMSFDSLPTDYIPGVDLHHTPKVDEGEEECECVAGFLSLKALCPLQPPKG